MSGLMPGPLRGAPAAGSGCCSKPGNLIPGLGQSAGQLSAAVVVHHIGGAEGRLSLPIAVVLATFLKYLLIILEKLAAIGHALKNLWNSAKQRRAERNLKEISDFSQLVAERAKTLSPTICEMAKNGVSVNFDVAAFARSVWESQTYKREKLPNSIKKMLFALLKAVLTALLKALLEAIF